MKMPFKGCMITSDLDGTLITPEFVIPQNNIEAKERFVEGGGKFALATGRSIESARQYAEAINPNAPCVVLNGVVIYDFRSDKILWDSVLPKEAANYLKKIKEKFPKLGMEIFAGHRLYLITSHPQTDKHVLNESLDYISAEIDDVPGKWYKSLFAGTSEEIDAVEEFCSTFEHPGVRFVKSSTIYYEMLPTNCDKGSGIKKLAELLSIDIKNTYGIGDFYNDVEMLDAAGIGVVTGNAPENLKQRADLVVCNCSEGAIAELVEYIGNKTK